MPKLTMAAKHLQYLKKNSDIDIVLLDVTLKTVSGFEVIKKIHVYFPTLPVLFVSMHDEAVYAERALRAGARGYVMKQEPGEILLTAIREVLKGNVFLSKKMHDKLLNRMATGGTEPEQSISRLTPSEFEVLHLIGWDITARKLQNYSAVALRRLKRIVLISVPN